MQPSSLLQLSLKEAFFLTLILIFIMGYLVIAQGFVPQLSIVIALVALLLYGLLRGLKFSDLQKAMSASVEAGMGAIYLFFFIGLLVSALMMSGAIPTLMFYGFHLISPKFFYLSAFLLSSVIGLAIGSSLTTCATVGVAFMGMGEAFGAHAPIVAGAVVSGAFFGDKMSPLSDTTAIAASVVRIDLFEHIKNMAFTTVPAFLLTALGLTFCVPHVESAQLNAIELLKQQLQETGLVHTYALLPFVVLVVLALRKVPALLAMLASIALAIALTYLHSRPSLAQLGQWFYSGFQAEGLGDKIARLLQRGGIESMFFTQTVVVLALSLGGLLFALGVVPALLSGMQRFVRTAGRATFSVAMTSLGINLLIGEQYLSILLSGETFKPIYEKLRLYPRNLSRTLEDAGTVINPLVPWSVCGVFIAKVLQVSVLDYLPYAAFCWLSLLLTLVFGFTGWTISQKNPAE